MSRFGVRAIDNLIERTMAGRREGMDGPDKRDGSKCNGQKQQRLATENAYQTT